MNAGKLHFIRKFIKSVADPEITNLGGGSDQGFICSYIELLGLHSLSGARSTARFLVFSLSPTNLFDTQGRGCVRPLVFVYAGKFNVPDQICLNCSKTVQNE